MSATPKGWTALLAGKRIWITAAANGIGRACAERFVAEGASVFATDIDADGLQTLDACPNRAVLDSTDARAVANYAARVGHLDAVVHCVGTVHNGRVLDCTAADWARSFDVNVHSFFHLLHAVLPSMIEARAGSIVCIASIASSLKGLPNRAAYGATKAALIGLVKSVAADFVSHGVRANAVCPGTVTSPSLLGRVEELGREVGGSDEAMAMFVARQPMGRLGTPEEIAGLCLYLASDESRFVTGQALAIDGGITI